jgi:hypothetical protein
MSYTIDNFSANSTTEKNCNVIWGKNLQCLFSAFENKHEIAM